MTVENFIVWLMGLSIFKGCLFFVALMLAAGFLNAVGRGIYFGWKQARLEGALRKYRAEATSGDELDNIVDRR